MKSPQETVAVILEALIAHGVPLEEVFINRYMMLNVPGWGASWKSLCAAEKDLIERHPELRFAEDSSYIRIPEDCVELLRNHLTLCSE